MTKPSVKFHIEQQDYFGTLATVICLINQGKDDDDVISAVLENIEQDLMYLQQNYLIIQKPEI